MNLLYWLRRLGIYRSGSCSGTYTSGKDRPTELQMDGVFDAKKDLVTRADFKPACPKCRKALKPDDRFCAGCGTPVAPGR